MDKFIFTILLTFVNLFFAVWFFNHINSWFGIGYGLATIYMSIKTILKQFKK